MIFFNSSLPRSGSTALQNILAQNPTLHCTVTSGVSHLLMGARQNMQNDPYLRGGNWQETERGFLDFCRGGLEGYYRGIYKDHIIDKSRNWLVYYEWLEAFYPNPKIICMVRELGGIVASLEKLHRRKRFMGDPTTDNLLSVNDRAMFFANNAPLGPTLQSLHMAFENGYADDILFVRYEDMCTDPDTEFKRIYNYLRIPFFQHDFENVTQLVPEHDAHYGIFGDHQIHPGPIREPGSNARKVLGDGPCNMLADANLWYYDRFKYPMRP